MALNRCRLAVLLAGALVMAGALAAWSQQDGDMTLWAKKNFSSWENPLHSEVSLNGKLINIFSSDSAEPIGASLKPGWNTLVLKTTPQVPAQKDNDLIFRVGPMHKEGPGKMVMEPVLWEFRNGTDWKLSGATYSHPLGPDVKDVTLTYKLYYAGMEHEGQKLKAGDYVLRGRPNFHSWNSPVVATVSVNGTTFNTFTVAERDIVITPFLKPGKNEIKIVSAKVPNAIKNNDILFEIMGPAEWEVSGNRFVLKPVMKFNAMQGWQLDRKTGQLSNPLKPQAETIERTLAFVMKE